MSHAELIAEAMEYTEYLRLSMQDQAAEYIESLCDVIAALQAEPVPMTDAPNWRDKLEAVIDIYIDGTENPPEDRTYAEGAFSSLMDELRAELKATGIKPKGE